MNNNDPNFSRMNRKRRSSKSNQLLNVLIGLVVLMIIVVGVFIIIDPKKSKDSELAAEQSSSDPSDSMQGEAQDEDDDADRSENEETDSESTNNQNADSSSSDGESEGTGADSADPSDDEEESPGTVTIVPNEDEVIEESIINTAWKPVGTEQTGVHESKYDGESVDWVEKQKAIAYATGFTENELIYWKIKNGGSPQKSIGIVSTKDKSKKFRVFLEWVDEQGWQPVKMDKLTTLDFEY
ncbi:YrrS family protein [Sporosarcina oncorhynchi]|uniref:YrrS family protein n=1 Tax=Sporosarcina oncorhynchi TaxID=3056444 RepID=A0ABZ0L932_9BACL|nr:YrrS family protein [Sporosarcina sp. T2O-4]WOV88787.1 YrrS family protein [Sporosarcina sp. T2O-4]